MYLDCRRKLEHSEALGVMETLHTHRAKVGFEPQPWRCEAGVLPSIAWKPDVHTPNGNLSEKH